MWVYLAVSVVSLLRVGPLEFSIVSRAMRVLLRTYRNGEGGGGGGRCGGEEGVQLGGRRGGRRGGGEGVEEFSCVLNCLVAKLHFHYTLFDKKCDHMPQ